MRTLNRQSYFRNGAKKTAALFLLFFTLHTSFGNSPVLAAQEWSPFWEGTPHFPTQAPGSGSQEGSGEGTDPTALFMEGSPFEPGGPAAPLVLPLAPAQTAPITKVPITSGQVPPDIETFVSYNPDDPDPALQDWSNLHVEAISPSSLRMDFNLYNTFSQAGVFMDYDDLGTESVENFNFVNVFPNGIVLALDNDGSGVEEVILEITDRYGESKAVTLGGITANSQKWKIDNSFFAGLDLTHISGLALFAQGRQVDGRIRVDWGDFSFIPEVASQAANPSLPTPLPHLEDGSFPEMQQYATPGDTATIMAYSTSYAHLDFNLSQNTSEAGAYFSYDEAATEEIETVDFGAAFPDGIVVGLDNGGFGNLHEVFFSVIDDQEREETVRLTGLTPVRKFFKITPDLFENVDFSKITAAGFFIEGPHSAGRLNIDWGDFTLPNFLYGTDYDPSELTSIGPDAVLRASGNGGGGKISLEQTNSQEFDYQYDLWNTNSASTIVDITGPGGSFFSLPAELVLAARGSEGGVTKVVVTDTDGRSVTFTLNLASVYQNFHLLLEGSHMPPFFKRDQVRSIRFLQDRFVNSSQIFGDVIKVQIKGLKPPAEDFPNFLLDFKSQMVEDGLKYFEVGKGVDPVTHLPYDRSNADGTLDPTHEITQPTLTGFYLQLLGDFIRGKMDWTGMTTGKALDEINFVLESLLDLQDQYGWKGLIPWIDQGQPYDIVGVGDNANLIQSLAVMIGALELADLQGGDRLYAQAITDKAELFMDRQEEGFLAAVDGDTGLFAAAVNRESGVPSGLLDRLVSEFRGALAFVAIRYPSLPISVWELPAGTVNYPAADGGAIIENLQAFDGSAFQYFWPLLRNNERDFAGFRNALYNHLVSQTDFAASHHLPGILSASDLPGGDYSGLIGLGAIAETDAFLYMNVASTYSLASAYSLDPSSVLNWLYQIKTQLPSLYGIYGFLDSARSGSDVNGFYLGIDLASAILGVNNAGPEAFEAYLRNRGKEHEYNFLYDQAQRLGIGQTAVPIEQNPEFADRSFTVFDHIQVDGTLGSFPYYETRPAGALFYYDSLGTDFDGRFWEFDQAYDAQANQLEIIYSVTDSPKSLKIELKDDSVPDHLLFQTTVETAPDNSPYQTLRIQLPNRVSMARVKKIFIMIDPSTGDAQGNFWVHSIQFKHLPSSQNLRAEISGAGTTVNQPYGVDLFSSDPGSHLDNNPPDPVRLYYNIPNSGDYAAVSLNPDPQGLGNQFFDLSEQEKVVFTLASDTVKTVKIEVDDEEGNRAVLFAPTVDVTKHYYEFLTASLDGSVNLKKIKRITFVVDGHSVQAGTTSGVLDVGIL